MSALFVAAILTITFPQRAAADNYDPPGRVARLNYLRGSVSFQPAGESDWVSAVVNRPMTTGDRLWTDDGARAEMHLGSATIRLGARTGLSFLNLDDRTVQIQLSEGTLNIRVLRLDRDEDFEVDTPNQAFSILRPGQYRIEATEDGNSTMVTVRAGEGEVTGGGRVYSVRSGESGDFTGTDSLYANISTAGGPDEFDSWSRDRDRHEDGSRSVRYVSRDVVGYEDLDDNGSWRSIRSSAMFGCRGLLPAGLPIATGIGPGFPLGAGPGSMTSRGLRAVPLRSLGTCQERLVLGAWPDRSPARVCARASGLYWRPQFGVAISVGGGGYGGRNVGWFPLGPREVYVPGYNASREYANRVNISNTTVNNTTITNVYNNQVTNNSGNNNGNNRNNTEIRYANRTCPSG